MWIVDPIDATANYARGIPIWATLIALQVEGELVLGVVGAPAIGERYEAVRGGGARMNGRPIHVSDIDDLADAQLFHARPEDVARRADGTASLSTCWPAPARTRGFGDFWGHTLVARGAGEAMLEPELNIWDYAAFQVVVEEAGGRVTQLDGSPTRHGGSVISSNGGARRAAAPGPPRVGRRDRLTSSIEPPRSPARAITTLAAATSCTPTPVRSQTVS